MRAPHFKMCDFGVLVGVGTSLLSNSASNLVKSSKIMLCASMQFIEGIFCGLY